MSVTRTALLAALACGFIACESEAPPPEAPAEDPCPEISMEGLAGDWIKVAGSKPDQKTRLRVLNEGGKWEGWFTAGGFTKKRMAGELRSEDLMLTEILTGARKEAFDNGQDAVQRLYIQPNKKRCAMRVVEVRVSMVDGSEKEQQVGAGYTEYLKFPEQYTFTFRPCDEQAFIEKAAQDWKVAKKQLDEGSVSPVGSLGEQVPVAAWSDPAADGPAECSYNMDLYFDDQPVEGKQQVAATEKSGRRHWYAEWYAPYSGNHHFEIYRYRACEGKERELIAVSCLEAVLD
ncbi:MAG: hypothetical protein H6739_31810 [Alphaproteobacteria bacterium]|nr:hypothetical protein [Alphaproteobacteria bacterium]